MTRTHRSQLDRALALGAPLAHLDETTVRLVRDPDDPVWHDATGDAAGDCWTSWNLRTQPQQRIEHVTVTAGDVLRAGRELCATCRIARDVFAPWQVVSNAVDAVAALEATVDDNPLAARSHLRDLTMLANTSVVARTPVHAWLVGLVESWRTRVVACVTELAPLFLRSAAVTRLVPSPAQAAAVGVPFFAFASAHRQWCSDVRRVEANRDRLVERCAAVLARGLEADGADASNATQLAAGLVEAWNTEADGLADPTPCRPIIGIVRRDFGIETVGLGNWLARAIAAGWPSLVVDKVAVVLVPDVLADAFCAEALSVPEPSAPPAVTSLRCDAARFDAVAPVAALLWTEAARDGAPPMSFTDLWRAADAATR